MMLELRVENLLLIERAELRLGPGLTVLTGETGAGKTVLAHALDLLLGGRPRAGIVRPGASEAYVEGVFAPPPGLFDDPALAELRERLPEADDELLLARRVGAEGRTRALVQGRTASAADLRELGGRLVSFYGQHEHRRLTLAAQQLEVLDAFCGAGHLERRAELSREHAHVRQLEAELAELRARTGAHERERDLLAYELEEIDALGPDSGEERSLREERERLRQVDALRAAAGGGAEALAAESGDGLDVVQALAESERRAEAVAGVDPALDALAERLQILRIETSDLGGELRRYADELSQEPGRLEEVEDRLDRYERLARKHGGSVESVLAHAERCRAELDGLETAEESIDGVERALAAVAAEEDGRARTLSAARSEAAPRLAEAVMGELSELGMDGASFSVEIEPRERRTALGDERVELLIAPNAGVAAAPLRETASGGELSRTMLALMSVASDGGPDAGEGGETLVFDEVDAGIGGQTARAVGRRLARLAEHRQVICITHLPQIASLADRHFRIEKRPGGDLAHTVVEELAGGTVVDELCRMLGGDADDDDARRHAEALLTAA
ncbi:MAG: DNA repair protein RecN [Thermoleophilaceae bacterium]|nr:DNA repair protein RecN [Thermoleophilaceae bacterium]